MVDLAEQIRRALNADPMPVCTWYTLCTRTAIGTVTLNAWKAQIKKDPGLIQVKNVCQNCCDTWNLSPVVELFPEYVE